MSVWKVAMTVWRQTNAMLPLGLCSLFAFPWRHHHSTPTPTNQHQFLTPAHLARPFSPRPCSSSSLPGCSSAIARQRRRRSFFQNTFFLLLKRCFSVAILLPAHQHPVSASFKSTFVEALRRLISAPLIFRLNAIFPWSLSPSFPCGIKVNCSSTEPVLFVAFGSWQLLFHKFSYS